MKIIGVETLILRQPEVRLIGDGTQDCLLVRVTTDEGLVGVGEVHTSPYAAEAIIHAPSSHVYARGLAGIIIGADPLNVAALWQRMYRQTTVYGRRGIVVNAISGLDMALWDLWGRATGQPLSGLLGGRFRDRIKAYASTLWPDDGDVAAEVMRWADRGFGAVKLGWGSLGQDIARDIAALKEARQAAGDGVDIMIDVGRGLQFKQALDLARRLEELNVYFLEEPLPPDDLDGYARLSGSTAVSIATGEKETTLDGFADLMERGRPDIIQPDLARCGGLTEARRIATVAGLRRVTVIPHCWSTEVLVRATTHFCAALPEVPYLEYCVAETPIRRRTVRNPVRLEDGWAIVPDEPGIGAELDDGFLEEFAYQGRGWTKSSAE